MSFFDEIEPAIRSIAGRIVDIRLATESEDQKEATDVVLTCTAGQIGLRVRRLEKVLEWWDITFRLSRASGVETELSKIENGKSKWFMYVAVDEKRPKGSQMVLWWVYDLDKFRDMRLWEGCRERINLDRRSSFVGVPISKMRPALIAEFNADQERLNL